MTGKNDIRTIKMRGNRVAKINESPDRTWDVKGASGAYKVTSITSCRNAGEQLFKAGEDWGIALGNWLDTVVLEMNHFAARDAFYDGWQVAKTNYKGQLPLFPPDDEILPDQWVIPYGRRR